MRTVSTPTRVRHCAAPAGALPAAIQTWNLNLDSCPRKETRRYGRTRPPGACTVQSKRAADTRGPGRGCGVRGVCVASGL